MIYRFVGLFDAARDYSAELTTTDKQNFVHSYVFTAVSW
jgi:hypothetical protein